METTSLSFHEDTHWRNDQEMVVFSKIAEKIAPEGVVVLPPYSTAIKEGKPEFATIITHHAVKYALDIHGPRNKEDGSIKVKIDPVTSSPIIESISDKVFLNPDLVGANSVIFPLINLAGLVVKEKTTDSLRSTEYGTHWRYAQINLTDSRVSSIDVYDSMDSKDNPVAPDIQRSLKLFLEKLDPSCKTENVSINNISNPDQFDGFRCGDYSARAMFRKVGIELPVQGSSLRNTLDKLLHAKEAILSADKATATEIVKGVLVNYQQQPQNTQYYPHSTPTKTVDDLEIERLRREYPEEYKAAQKWETKNHIKETIPFSPKAVENPQVNPKPIKHTRRSLSTSHILQNPSGKVGHLRRRNPAAHQFISETEKQNPLNTSTPKQSVPSFSPIVTQAQRIDLETERLRKENPAAYQLALDMEKGNVSRSHVAPSKQLNRPSRTLTVY